MKLALHKLLLLNTLALGALVSACGSAKPSEALVDARRAFSLASQSKAASYVPDRLLTAQQALEQAEKAHKDEANSFNERSLAYIAQRRAELAMAYGNVAEAHHTQKNAQTQYQKDQDSMRRHAQSRVTELEGRVESAQEGRAQAEQQAQAALASLQQIANVKEDARGVVISLSGAVLFTTGSSDLTAMARQSLDKVVTALQSQRSDRPIVVQGYTDSRGSDELNTRLSQERAEAVREYLITKGLSSQRVQAVGKGESEPIASNDTPEGRANNRRVEIIISNPQGGSSSSRPGSQSNQ